MLLYTCVSWTDTKNIFCS